MDREESQEQRVCPATRRGRQRRGGEYREQRLWVGSADVHLRGRALG